MEEKAAVLFRELEEICSQYKREVPGRRRAWPESVKKRVLALRALGINSHQFGPRLDLGGNFLRDNSSMVFVFYSQAA